MFLREGHPKNAYCCITVTLSCITTDIRSPHDSKHLVFTPSTGGNSTVPDGHCALLSHSSLGSSVVGENDHQHHTEHEIERSIQILPPEKRLELDS